MPKRAKIAIGMALAIIWSVLIVWLPQIRASGFLPLNSVMMTAFFPAGLVMMLLIARLAHRRFFDDAFIDGAQFASGSAAEIDQRVLTNTVEQIVLALALWPFAALTLGGAVVIWMGLGFAMARIAFWLGYHLSPPLRAFGFGATFYPTVLAALWAVAKWIS